MIVDERLVTYINSLDAGNTAMLDQIEREATADYVPIIRKEMQSFLKFLLAMKKPACILEVGTAVGFSAILMAEYDSFPAGDSASSGEGRRAGVGQCAAGRRCDRIKVRGYKAEPHDS